MGHHGKKKQYASAPTGPADSLPGLDINSIAQLLNNVDVSAMSNIMKNIDMNQIMSLMGNIPTMNPFSGDNKTSNVENISEPVLPKIEIPKDSLSHELPSSDPVAVVLGSLKPLLPEEKCKIIDDMIHLLGIKQVIDTIFPSKNDSLKANS